MKGLSLFEDNITAYWGKPREPTVNLLNKLYVGGEGTCWSNE